MNYPTGESVDYLYDSAWRQTSVCSEAGNGYPGLCYAQNTQYTALDQPQGVQFGNGLQQSYSYDTVMQRLQQLRVGTSSNPASLWSRTYSYDPVGNVSSINNLTSGEAQSFSYDYLDRLTDWTATLNGAQTANEQFLFGGAAGAAGNLTQKGGVSYSYDLAHPSGGGGPYAVRNSGYSYDANGNMLTEPTRALTWNQDNQPTGVSVTGGPSAGTAESYTYDADGERLTRAFTQAGPQPQQTTTTYYIGGMYEEDMPSGTVRVLYQFNGQTVAQREIAPVAPTSTSTSTPTSTPTPTPTPTSPNTATSTNTATATATLEPVATVPNGCFLCPPPPCTCDPTPPLAGPQQAGAGARAGAQASSSSSTTTDTLLYLHQDHLGSVSMATDAWGNVLSRQEYDPWGKVRSGANPGPVVQTKLNFTGQRLDNTGLLYYNARYYDPSLARFVSPDSIVPGASSGVGGAGGTMGQQQNSKLTVDFHESGFVSSANGENAFTLQKGFWFQLGAEDKQTKEAMSPMNAQTLNRYAYTLNNPVRYIDPTGHAPLPIDIYDRKLDPGGVVETQEMGIPIGRIAVGVLRFLAKLMGTGGRAAVRLGTTFGKIGTLVKDPGIERTFINDYAAVRLSERGITTAMLDKWATLPKAVFSQANGTKFLYVTDEGSYVLDQAGRLVTAYNRGDYTDDMVALCKSVGVCK